jgi:hypothetical protein
MELLQVRKHFQCPELKITTLEYKSVQNTGVLRHEKQAELKIPNEREYKETAVCDETCHQQLGYQTLQLKELSILSSYMYGPEYAS